MRVNYPKAWATMLLTKNICMDEFVECGYCHGDPVPEEDKDYCSCPTCDGDGGYFQPKNITDDN